MKRVKMTATSALVSASVLLLPLCSSFVSPSPPMAFTTTNAVHQRQQTTIGMANANDIQSSNIESADFVSSDSSFGNVFDRRKIILGVGGLLSSSLVQYSNNDDNFSFRAAAAEAQVFASNTMFNALVPKIESKPGSPVKQMMGLGFGLPSLPETSLTVKPKSVSKAQAQRSPTKSRKESPMKGVSPVKKSVSPAKAVSPTKASVKKATVVASKKASPIKSIKTPRSKTAEKLKKPSAAKS